LSLTTTGRPRIDLRKSAGVFVVVEPFSPPVDIFFSLHLHIMGNNERIIHLTLKSEEKKNLKNHILNTIPICQKHGKHRRRRRLEIPFALVKAGSYSSK
jgi:hypothetical protein